MAWLEVSRVDSLSSEIAGNKRETFSIFYEITNFMWFEHQAECFSHVKHFRMPEKDFFFPMLLLLRPFADGKPTKYLKVLAIHFYVIAHAFLPLGRINID